MVRHPIHLATLCAVDSKYDFLISLIESNLPCILLTGQLKDGKKHGLGSYKFSNGDVYVGSFKVRFQPPLNF